MPLPKLEIRLIYKYIQCLKRYLICKLSPLSEKQLKTIERNKNKIDKWKA